MDVRIFIVGFASCITVSADQCETYSTFGRNYYTYCSTCCSYVTSRSSPCCYYSYSYDYDIGYIYSGALSVAAIVGIVIGSLIAVAIVISIIVCCVCCMRKTPASSGQVITSGVSMQPVVTTVSSSNMTSMAGGPGMNQQPPYGYSNNGFVAGSVSPPPPVYSPK